MAFQIKDNIKILAVAILFFSFLPGNSFNYSANATPPVTLGDETTNSFAVEKSSSTLVNSKLGDISKMVITAYPSSERVSLVLSTNKGTLQFTTTTGLTTEVGYQSPVGAAAATIKFYGTVANINNGLESLKFNATSNEESATLTATLLPAPTAYGTITYWSENGHYYERVNDYKTWDQAYDATFGCARTYNGLCGYLATVTSAAENTFIDANVIGVYSSHILGGADNGGRTKDESLKAPWGQGVWRWADGPVSEKYEQFSTNDNVANSVANWFQYSALNGSSTSTLADKMMMRNDGTWQPISDAQTANYIVEYGDAGGAQTYNTATRSISISISDIPPAISYSTSSVTAIINSVITTLTPTNSGGTVSSWSIDPTLPTGISFNTSTGVISGTPTVVSTSTAYEITATGAGGSDSETVTFEVVLPPDISYPDNSVSFTKDSAISPITPTNDGGPISTWAISPDLPAGLNFNTATGVISGTPTVTSSDSNYTITATNLGQSSTFTISITVDEPESEPAPAPAPAPVIPTYQVAYLANGGESRELPMAIRYYSDSIVRTTTSVPTRVGYTFLNWNSSADGTGKTYIAGDLISIGDSDRTLYAQWKINTYKLDFESGFDNLIKMDSKIENYGTTTSLPGLPTDFERIGYTFLGWNTNKDGSGTKYLVGDKFTYPASDTTLVAQWKINTYLITFDGNGLQRGKTPSTITQEFNSALTIKSPTGSFTRKGYKFECWNTERDGLGKDYKAGDVLVIGASNQTLYAKWTPNSYRVTYLSAFQESSIIDQFLTDGSILSAPTPKNRQGYVFKGWSNSPYKTNIVSFPYTPGVTRNISLYAVWERTK